MSFPSLQCDLTFTLITYGFALSNLSSTVVTSLGNYELERHTTDSDRQAKDERLNFAANLLCRASGVFLYISDTVLPEWEKAHGTMAGRPPELTKEVTQALSKYVATVCDNSSPSKYHYLQARAGRCTGACDTQIDVPICIRLDVDAWSSSS